MIDDLKSNRKAYWLTATCRRIWLAAVTFNGLSALIVVNGAA